MAITREQVFAAAAELVAAGQKPTLEGVRQITGGSYTTISPALNAWKAQQAVSVPLQEPAPPAVSERLAELGVEVWGIALDLANARLAAEREALEKARSDMEAERIEAIELADRLSAQVEEGQSRLAAAEASAAQAIAALESQFETAQEQWQEQALAWESERAALREQLTQAQLRAGQAEVRADERQQQIEGLQARVDDLKKELDLTHRKLSQDVRIQERLEHLESRLKG